MGSLTTPVGKVVEMAEVKKEVTRFKFEAAPVRMIFGSLIKPIESNYGNGRKSALHFEIQAGMPPEHPDFKSLKATMNKVARVEFGGDMTDAEWNQYIKDKKVSFPIKDGTKIADKGKAKGKNREACRGLVMFKASSSAEYPPALCFVTAGGVVDVEERSQAASKFYPGVEVGMEVTLKAYPGNDSNIPNSVVAYLSTVCSLGRGEKLGGSAASRYTAFAKNVGTISDDNPMDGADDEVPM